MFKLLETLIFSKYFESNLKYFSRTNLELFQKKFLIENRIWIF